jgi:uncharacterized Ntn-hydrolase superfamily protein
MDDGATADVALQRLLEEDAGRDHRQVGLVDCDGNAVTHTGRLCYDWAGGTAREGVAAQGNILVGPEVVDAMLAAWDAAADEPDLARRLLRALQAGDAAGGDSRGRQSASLLVVREGAGYAGGDDVAVDLRVDDHADPCTELERLLNLNDLYLTASTEAERVPITPELQNELDDRARSLGRADFDAWVGAENLEMRAGPDWVDRMVVEMLRSRG